MEKTSLSTPRFEAGPGKDSPGYKSGSPFAVRALGRGGFGSKEGGSRPVHLISRRTASQDGVCHRHCLVPVLR